MANTIEHILNTNVDKGLMIIFMAFAAACGIFNLLVVFPRFIFPCLYFILCGFLID